MIWKGRKMLSGPHRLPWNTELEGIFPALGKVCFLLFFFKHYVTFIVSLRSGYSQAGKVGLPWRVMERCVGSSFFSACLNDLGAQLAFSGWRPGMLSALLC